MAGPQTQQGKEKEKIFFIGKYEIEIFERESYIDHLNEWTRSGEAKVNGNLFTLDDNKLFNEILESLKAKINVLRYVSDDTYDKLKEDIVKDLLEIMLKLEKKHHH